LLARNYSDVNKSEYTCSVGKIHSAHTTQGLIVCSEKVPFDRHCTETISRETQNLQRERTWRKRDVDGNDVGQTIDDPPQPGVIQVHGVSLAQLVLFVRHDVDEHLHNDFMT